jgi:SAM-dependent methyltransferase
MSGGEREATAWFERLYAAAESGDAVIPWDKGAPHPLLEDWVRHARPEGRGRRALVVGAGFGHDAELLAGLGFDTVAFDISPTAVRTARALHPGSRVEYVTADLLDPPSAWRAAFDFVVEVITVQALPEPLRAEAIANVVAMVAPGGALLVISAARGADEHVEGPPWPLTRAEIDAFAAGDLEPVRVEDLRDAPVRRWRAELRRPSV